MHDHPVVKAFAWRFENSAVLGAGGAARRIRPRTWSPVIVPLPSCLSLVSSLFFSFLFLLFSFQCEYSNKRSIPDHVGTFQFCVTFATASTNDGQYCTRSWKSPREILSSKKTLAILTAKTSVPPTFSESVICNTFNSFND